MQKITTVINILIFCIIYTENITGQQIDLFPVLPFDRALAASKGYTKASIQLAYNERGEEDEPGYLWSIPKVQPYQIARYSFSEEKIDFETRYKPDGDKLVSWQYHYRQGLLSAIDEFEFDSLQTPILHYTYVYYYDAKNNPFQKVAQFARERNFRLLYDYSFDAQGRPVKEKITATGQIRKWESIKGLRPGLSEQLTFAEYRDDVRTVRVYQNLHTVIETYITQYDLETKLPQRLELQDAQRRTVWIKDYDYNASRLLDKETHYVPNEDGELVPTETVHYFYDADDLLERKLVERGKEQEVYYYYYFME